MATVSTSWLTSLVGDLTAERPPVYAALSTRLRVLVGDGRLPVGVRLPAERDLAAGLGVSRATVTAAYRRLRDDGWAVARQGAGTWTRLPAGPAVGAWVPGPVPEGVIDMAHAAPSAPPQVSAAFNAALDDLPRLLPGHGYHPQGLPDLRARVADRFSARGLPTTPEQVLITSGALHALTVVVDVVVRRGQRVLVEHPSYPNALDAIAARGARRVPVAIDAHEPGAVAWDMLRAAQQASPVAAYVMPDFQNPTGLHLGVDQRARLAVGLQQAGVTCIVDETLADLAFDGPAAPPFAAVAGHDDVITVGTMSKSFWGGLRIGWVRADTQRIQQMVAASARGHLSGPVLEQLAAGHLLDAADEVLTVRRTELQQRRDVLASAIAARLPAWRVRLPEGGLVLWCQLPNPASSRLVAAADAHGLRLAAGPRFGTGHAFEDRLRLPFTQPVDVLGRAVEILAEVATDLPRQASAGADHDRVVV